MHLDLVTTGYEKIGKRMTRLLSRQPIMVVGLCVAAVGVGAQAASAVVILSEDFESYDMDNPFPASPPWIDESTGTGNTFEPDASAQSTLSAGTQGLLVVDNDTNSTQPRGFIEFSPVAAGALATHNLRMTFDVNMVDPDNLSNYLLRLADTGDAQSQIGPSLLLDRATDEDDPFDPPYDGGTVWVWDGPSNANRFVKGVNDGTSTSDSGTALSTDEWHRIVVDVFMADFEYQVTIDGGTPSPLLNWVGSPPQLDRIRLADNFAGGGNPVSDGGAIYLDNFLIETFVIPEPASAVLLGIGLVLLGMRRRRVC